MKRFNRANELLADAAEKAERRRAMCWRAQPYPTERLRDAWIRFLWHQFHDDLTGTCIPQAYQFSWNDEIASLNQFAGVLTQLDERRVEPARHRPAPACRSSSTTRCRWSGREADRSDASGSAPPATARDRRRRGHGRDRAGAGASASAAAARASCSSATVPSLGYRVFTCSRRPAAAATPSSLKVTTDVAREQPHQREDRPERRHRVDLRQGREARAAARRRSCSSCATIRRRRGRRGKCCTTPCSRPRASTSSNPTIKVIERGPARVGARDHAQGGRVHVRAARPAGRRRRSRRRREPRRLALAELAAQGVVPVHRVESEGDLRPRPRHDRAHEQRAGQVRSAGAAVGGHRRRRAARSASASSTTASTAGTSRTTTRCG